jgi:short-subunit dehydrogenase
VIATARDKAKGEAAIKDLKNELGESVKISFVLLDLASFSSIEKAVKEIKSIISKQSLNLNMLILNVTLL